MKILPYIILSSLGMLSATPLVTANTGLLLSKSPKIASSQTQSCTTSQKDQYGRCPYTSRSNFRYLSTSGGSGTGGRSGTGGGGGK
jgi:hypothetical protein